MYVYTADVDITEFRSRFLDARAAYRFDPGPKGCMRREYLSRDEGGCYWCRAISVEYGEGTSGWGRGGREGVGAGRKEVSAEARIRNWIV